MDFEIYCDESRAEYFQAEASGGAARYVLIGGIWIEAEQRAGYKQAIHRLREQQNARDDDADAAPAQQADVLAEEIPRSDRHEDVHTVGQRKSQPEWQKAQRIEPSAEARHESQDAQPGHARAQFREPEPAPDRVVVRAVARPHLEENLRCRRQQWWKKPPILNSVFPCWDPEGLWDIQVPGTWKTQFQEKKWYNGRAVYFKEFNAQLAR